jgi:hypothetical protein
MISYKLALKLKEAGFIQPDAGQTFYGIWGDEEGVHRGGISEEDIYFPTLLELIEACGERFKGLWRTPEGQWKALSTYESDVQGVAQVYELFGTCPDEAVADLWLALTNGKQSS